MNTDLEPSDTSAGEAAASEPSSSTPPAPPEAVVPEARASTPEPASRPDRDDERPGREPGDLVVAMSPRQIIGGFALLAGLILLLRRSRRKG